jgi:hypothetical protein
MPRPSGAVQYYSSFVTQGLDTAVHPGWRCVLHDKENVKSMLGVWGGLDAAELWRFFILQTDFCFMPRPLGAVLYYSAFVTQGLDPAAVLDWHCVLHNEENVKSMVGIGGGRDAANFCVIFILLSAFCSTPRTPGGVRYYSNFPPKILTPLLFWIGIAFYRTRRTRWTCWAAVDDDVRTTNADFYSL